jgi:hypothetical protein
MRWLWLCTIGCTGGAGDCPVGDLSESHYCGDDGNSCAPLDSLSQGCIGSHTEQSCERGDGAWTLVGGDSFVERFYEGNTMVAVRRIGEGSSDTCPDAWFGLDLSDCTPVGEPVTVECDPQGE